MSHVHVVDAETFWSYVDKENGPVHPDLRTRCWLWLGSIVTDGYGIFYFSPKHRSIGAHRFALELTIERPIAPKMLALHHCDNPPCCNPEHLYEGTVRQNVADKFRRGRANIASGDAHGLRLHPEAVPRGDQHYSRRSPELVSRGDNHYTRRNPELAPRGERNGQAKLTAADVDAIRAEKATGKSGLVVAAERGISFGQVYRIWRGERW